MKATLLALVISLSANLSLALEVVYWQDSIDILPNQFVELSNTNEGNYLQEMDKTNFKQYYNIDIVSIPSLLSSFFSIFEIKFL